MPAISGSVSALAVAVIFYIWRGYAHLLWRRERTLRERVAYMLWTLANKEQGLG